MVILDFEQHLYKLEEQIAGLKCNSDNATLTIVRELENQYYHLLQHTYSKLTPWQIVQIARHPDRPKSFDYINKLFTDTFEIEGDRCGNTDQALLAMFCKFNQQSVMLIVQEKGKDLETRQRHNYGMVSPAGYRKAIRAVELASKWEIPIITLIDTSGAYPCQSAEEQGQAEAIARSMAAFFKAKVPIIACVIGEGGSGGAIGIGVANTVMMLKYSIYSIAAPEAVSSILFKTSDQKELAAEKLKLTAQDLKKTGYVDIIIPEEAGGAHKYKDKTIAMVGQYLQDELDRLMKIDKLLTQKAREQKFLNFGREFFA